MEDISDICSATRKHDIELVKLLILKGYDLNHQCSDTLQTAMHICSRHGYVDIAKLLLEHKARVNIFDRNGFTCLHYAVYYKSYEIAIEIVKSKIMPNILNIGVYKPQGDNREEGSQTTDAIMNECIIEDIPLQLSALQMSVLFCNDEIFKTFVGIGVCDFYYKSADGKTTLDIIQSRDNCVELISYLAKNSDLLVSATAHADEKTAMECVRYGADVNQMDKYGFSILHLAVEQKLHQLVELLVKKGVDIDKQVYHTNYTRRYQQGRTALHVACCNNDVISAKILLQAGASVSIRDAHADRAFGALTERLLIRRCRVYDWDCEEVMKMFFENGLDISHYDDIHTGYELHHPVNLLLISAGLDPWVLVNKSFQADHTACLPRFQISPKLRERFLIFPSPFARVVTRTLQELAGLTIRKALIQSGSPNIWYAMRKLDIYPDRRLRSYITLISDELKSFIDDECKQLK